LRFIKYFIKIFFIKINGLIAKYRHIFIESVGKRTVSKQKRNPNILHGKIANGIECRFAPSGLFCGAARTVSVKDAGRATPGRV